MYGCIVECKKIFSSLTFIYSCIFVALLCLCNGIYMDESGENSYTVLEVLFLLPSDIRKTELSALRVILSGLNNPYAQLFLPIATGICFVPQFCMERKTESLRLQLVRCSKNQYLFHKIFSASIGGGFTVMIGYLLYSLLIWNFFPHFASDDLNLYGLSPLCYYLKSCAGSFICGVTSVFLPFAFCSVWRSPYVILCLPVCLLFIQTIAEDFVQNKYFKDVLMFTRPLGAMRVVVFDFSLWHFGLILIVPLLSSLLFCVSFLRKVDCGA